MLPVGDRDLPPGDELPDLVAHRVQSSGVPGGISRAMRERLRHGHLPPVVDNFLLLLSVVGGEAVALDGQGTFRRLRLPSPLTETAPPPRRRRKPATRITYRRSVLGKKEIINLHREGLRPAQIAAQAGISTERIGQILRLFGIEPARQQRLRERIAACRMIAPDNHA